MYKISQERLEKYAIQFERQQKPKVEQYSMLKEFKGKSIICYWSQVHYALAFGDLTEIRRALQTVLKIYLESLGTKTFKKKHPSDYEKLMLLLSDKTRSVRKLIENNIEATKIVEEHFRIAYGRLTMGGWNRGIYTIS